MRFWPGLLGEPTLRHVVDGAGLDRLYLDNTYCSPECVFPLREVVLKQVIRYLRYGLQAIFPVSYMPLEV